MAEDDLEDQLESIARQLEVPCVVMRGETDVLKIAKKAKENRQ